MPRDVSDDGNRNAIPCQMICLVARGPAEGSCRAAPSGAVSRADINRGRILSPSTPNTICRDDPLAGVRRQPATPSNLASALWTLFPQRLLVRLQTPPATRTPAAFATSTFARFARFIIDRRVSISAWASHSASSEGSSVRSSKRARRSVGLGMLHNIQERASASGRSAWAFLIEDACQSERGQLAAPTISRSRRTATTKSRGRDCGTNSAASATNSPQPYPRPTSAP